MENNLHPCPVMEESMLKPTTEKDDVGHKSALALMKEGKSE